MSFDTWTDEAGRMHLAGDNFMFAVSHVPGKQTVPRAELHAGITGAGAQRWQNPEQRFEAWTVDAKYVEQGWARQGAKRSSRFGRSFGAGANADLWQVAEAPEVWHRLPAPLGSTHTSPWRTPMGEA